MIVEANGFKEENLFWLLCPEVSVQSSESVRKQHDRKEDLVQQCNSLYAS